MRTSAKRKMRRISKRHEKVASQKFERVTSPFFRFDAAIRIAGVGRHHDAITARTGLIPSKTYLAGEKISPHSDQVRKADMWILSSPLSRALPLEDHIDWLLAAVTPHTAYLEDVIGHAEWADLCLGCLSDIPYPLIAAGKSATELIKKLNLQISFNFTCR